MSFRFFRAYLTTFLVLGSYIWLNFKGRFMTDESLDERRMVLNRKNAKRIEDTILSLQGLFIKVGQAFSIMTNFLPEEFMSGLKNLQDAVPARPYSQIETRIMDEFGESPHCLFSHFDETPIASASLGQVHEATTKDGQRVAVKVQHLGVEKMAKSDLKTIKRIVGIVKYFLKIRGLDNFYQEIRSMIVEELDFTHEAAHIERIADNFKENSMVLFPRVVKEFSSPHVLTMEFVDGVKISDREKIVAMGLDPAKITENLITVFCQMIFVDGIYHADPHPGNILVHASGKLVLLDFGAVGHLSEKMRGGVNAFLEAIIKGNESQLIASLETMGFLRTGASDSESEAATKVIEYFHRRFQEEIKLENFSLSEIKIDPQKGVESLADIRKMDIGIRELSSAFYVPKEWVLMERVLLLLAGICTRLAPETNPAAIIRPYLEEFVIGKDKDWSSMLIDLLQEKMLSFISLPSMIQKTLNQCLNGKISFQVYGLPQGVERIYASMHQLIYTLLTLGGTGVSLFFYDRGDLMRADWALRGTGICLGALFFSMLRARRFRAKR